MTTALFLPIPGLGREKVMAMLSGGAKAVLHHSVDFNTPLTRKCEFKHSSTFVVKFHQHFSWLPQEYSGSEEASRSVGEKLTSNNCQCEFILFVIKSTCYL